MINFFLSPQAIRKEQHETFGRNWDKVVFEKMFKFTGDNLKSIVENPSHEGLDNNPGQYCFRLNKNKVYYASEALVKHATNVARPNLV